MTAMKKPRLIAWLHSAAVVVFRIYLAKVNVDDDLDVVCCIDEWQVHQQS